MQHPYILHQHFDTPQFNVPISYVDTDDSWRHSEFNAQTVSKPIVGGVEKGALLYVLDGESKGKVGLLKEMSDTGKALMDFGTAGSQWMRADILIRYVLLQPLHQ